ncbi:MAG: hypothetical protein QMD05_07480 [Candidatus Brocadiaceae bacterium]|nr:hypothetical protein [Candidatus Brocadiaceae bacterium]
MARKKTHEHEPEGGSQEPKLEGSFHEHMAEASSHSHGHTAECGGLLSGRLTLGLLVALSLGFGVVMAKKYMALEAKAGAGVITPGAAPAKDPEVEKALLELGKKLGAIKSELDELEPVLKKLGVKVEKPAGSHEHH